MKFRLYTEGPHEAFGILVTIGLVCLAAYAIPACARMGMGSIGELPGLEEVQSDE